MSRLYLALALALGLSACDRLKGTKPVDIAPITVEDDALQKSQTDISAERGNLQRERKKISDARAEIVDRRKQLGHDSAGQSALDEEEKKLIEAEGSLSSKESELNGKLDELIKQRSELVKKATQVVSTGTAADPLERAAKREQTVAEREKAMALREKDVAQREKDIADRESRQARREKETCGTAPAPVQIEIPKGLKYSSKDVEPTYKKALKIMQERGLLDGDLPPGAQRLIDDTREAMKKADYGRAKYDAESLLSAVEDIKIDRAFISAKMARLAAAMRGKKLEGDHRKAVEELFQDATANYGDGKFPQANGKINRLFGLLR